MFLESLMDTDQYIFTMCQAVLRKYPNAIAKFKFKCRNQELRFDEQKMAVLNDAIDKLCYLRFKKDELEYCNSIRYFEPFFIEYLRLLQLNREYINCYSDDNGILQIDIEGPLSSIIWFEVPVLRLVSWIHHLYESSIHSWGEGYNRLCDKINYVKENIHYPQLSKFQITDFGTRRAFSPPWHLRALKLLSKEDFFAGTSNMLFAKKMNLTPIGTMAHLWIQAHQQLGPRLVDSQKEAFKAWVDVYQGDLGIALSDTVGFDAFLRDFNRYYAKLFDGARHDSGDPYRWCERLINHYKSYGIDPRTKTAVFSDGLNFKIAVDLFKRFMSQIKTSFGIGTNLTNDLGVKALQIVIKMIECSPNASEPMRPVAKIPDSYGKIMCVDDSYFIYLKNVFRIKEG